MCFSSHAHDDIWKKTTEWFSVVLWEEKALELAVKALEVATIRGKEETGVHKQSFVMWRLRPRLLTGVKSAGKNCATGTTSRIWEASDWRGNFSARERTSSMHAAKSSKASPLGVVRGKRKLRSSNSLFRACRSSRKANEPLRVRMSTRSFGKE